MNRSEIRHLTTTKVRTVVQLSTISRSYDLIRSKTWTSLELENCLKIFITVSNTNISCFLFWF